MSLAAEFDSRTDRRAYALVAAGAAALSYAHARAFFLPVHGHRGRVGHAADARRGGVLARLRRRPPGQGGPPAADAALRRVRRAGADRDRERARRGDVAERVFLALPAALFGFLTEVRTRLALYEHRAAHGDDRLRAAAVAASPGAHRPGVAVAGPPVRPRVRPRPLPSGTGCAPPATPCGWPCPAGPGRPAVPAPGCCGN